MPSYSIAGGVPHIHVALSPCPLLLRAGAGGGRDTQDPEERGQWHFSRCCGESSGTGRRASRQTGFLFPKGTHGPQALRTSLVDVSVLGAPDGSIAQWWKLGGACRAAPLLVHSILTSVTGATCTSGLGWRETSPPVDLKNRNTTALFCCFPG